MDTITLLLLVLLFFIVSAVGVFLIVVAIKEANLVYVKKELEKILKENENNTTMIDVIKADIKELINQLEKTNE